MELTSAFVLHQRPYRETSLLVDVFTEPQGRISLIARGVRQKRKRQQNFPQLFQPFLLSWYGQSDLVSLSQFEVYQAPYSLKGNACLCGLYLNELLVRLLPIHEPEQAIFDAYQLALARLAESTQNEVTLRLFEKQLLLHLGYGLELSNEANTGAMLDDERQYIYLIESGPKVNDDRAATNTISGRSLRHLREEQGFDERSLGEIKRLMRQVIDHYLGGRPLQSRSLFAQLKQFNS